MRSTEETGERSRFRLDVVGIEHVAFAASRLDVSRQIRIALDLAAEPEHEHIDVAVDVAIAFRAKPIEDLRPTHRLVGGLRKDFKQGEFGRRQRFAAVGEADGLPAHQVDGPIAKQQRGTFVLPLTLLFLFH